MARTFVRQTQISGSFIVDDRLNFANRSANAAASSSLQSDLNIIRSSIFENFGLTGSYYENVVPYNLSALGVKVNSILGTQAAFTGMVSMPNVDVSGTGSFGNNVSVTGNLSASADVYAGGEIKINADVPQRLYIVGSTGELKDEANLTFNGSQLAVVGGISGSSNLLLGGDATIAGDVSANDGTFTGNMTISGDLYVNGTTTYINTTELLIEDKVVVIASGATGNEEGQSAGIQLGTGAGFASLLYSFDNDKWTLSDDLDITGKLKIDGDVAQRLYIVDSDGTIKDESKLIYDGSALKVTGSVEALTGSFELVSSANELKLDDSRFNINLSDSNNASLSGSLYTGVSSIVGAFNVVKAQLDLVGSGHQKDVIGIGSTVTAVTSSLDLGNGLNIADDLNVYVNGVLVHVSGSAASEAGVVGVDAAKKDGENVVLFAFELRAGDVVTLEKF